MHTQFPPHQNKIKLLLTFWLVCSCLLIAAFNKNQNRAFASTEPTANTSTNPQENKPNNLDSDANKTPSNTNPPEPRVIKVTKWGHEKGDESKQRDAGIGDTIIVLVQNYKSLINQSECLDNNKQTIPNCNKQDVVLVLDGRKIPGITAKSIAFHRSEQTPETEPDTIKMMFELKRNASNNEIWTYLLGAPALDDDFFKRKTAVSVSLENGMPIQTIVNRSQEANKKNIDFQLVRVRKIRFAIASIGFFVALILLIKLGKNSNLLREPIFIDQNNNKQNSPYSLGRCQMAIWFYLVIGSFLYIWLVTSSDEITNSALVLMGIGTGTALGAAAIDASKKISTTEEKKNLEIEKIALEKDISEATTTIASNPPNLTEQQLLLESKKTRYANLENQLKLLSTKPSKTSNGFLKDILNENNGICFHRFQMFIWTIVLACIFIYSVWDKLSMPEFSTTLLALQGISAGTYISFKIPEKA